MGEHYCCPYPDCDWSSSRPLNTDVRLTQAVLKHEVERHRQKHGSDTSN